MRKLGNSWTLLFVLLTGVMVLMLSARPELQPRPGEEQSPAAKLRVAGHSLTWPPAAVLGYRMLSSMRAPAEAESSQESDRREQS